MTYRYDTFLKPITTTDRNIQILNDDGIVVYTVNPFSVLDIMVSNNLLKINLKSKRIISIPFLTNNESRLAIVKFQEQLDTLKSKVPGFIDKKIENYVESQIGSSVSYGNGLVFDSGTVSVGGTLSNTLYLDGQFYDLVGVGFDNISFTSSVFDVVSNLISLDSTENIQILADNDVTLFANGQLALTGNSGLVSIGNTQGLVYYEDYSSGFVDRSLVDKAYVLSNQVSINNSGVGRILTSVGNATGSNAESNLTFDGFTFSVNGTSVFSGHTIFQQTSEVINTTPGATNSVVVYDFTDGSIWYHSTASTNYSANFINIPETNNRAITATIIISQGATGYFPNSVSINGVAQNVKWSGGTYSVSSNKIDIIGFTFLRTGSSWSQVFGQISSFS